MLRHPVVISSLTEDFKKIGLLAEGESDYETKGSKDLPDQKPGEVGSGAAGHKPMTSKTGPGPDGGYSASPAATGSWLKYRVGEARPEKQSADRKDPNIDYVDEDEAKGQIEIESEEETSEESIEEAANIQAFAEAVKFAEEFDRDYAAIDEDAEENFVLNKMEMRELEDMGESVTLGFDVLAEDEDSDEEPAISEKKAAADDEDDEDDSDDDSDDSDDDESDDDDPDADDDDMDEGKRRIAGTHKMMRTKRASSREKMLAKKYYRQNRSAIKKRRGKIAKTSHGKKLAKFGEAVSQHLDRIQEFVDSTGSFDASDMEESKKAFANVALISDALREEFEVLHAEHPDHEEYDFGKLSFHLGEMAAQAEAIAERLDEGANPDADSLASAFKQMAENLIASLDAFADLDEGIEEDPADDDSDGDTTPAEDDTKESKKKSAKKDEAKGGFPFKKGMTGKGKTPAGKESEEC